MVFFFIISLEKFRWWERKKEKGKDAKNRSSFENFLGKKLNDRWFVASSEITLKGVTKGDSTALLRGFRTLSYFFSLSVISLSLLPYFFS